MSERNEDKVTPERYDFMFLETFRDSIEKIRAKYSDEMAGIFIMELIRYGTRRERKVQLEPYLEATLVSMYPYIKMSHEHKEQTEKRFKDEAALKAINANRKKKKLNETDTG